MISQETKDRMSQIASACIRCRRCMRECLMLSRFAENPKALFTQYLELGPENMDRHIAYSCNECSQCTLKCPKDLNLKSVFQSLKADYAAENQGIVPVEALLPSEKGQSRECSPKYCTTLTAGTGQGAHGKAKYLFVPGRFPADPILQHLRSALGAHNVELLPYTGETLPGSEILKALEAAEGSVLITACPSSFQALRETVRSHRVLFYWDLMEDIIGIPPIDQDEQGKILLEGTDSIGSGIRWVLNQLSGQWQDPQPQKQLTLQDADRDCRQILGLLFGEPGEEKEAIPYPMAWGLIHEHQDPES